MASILRVNTLTDASSNNSTAVSVINQGSCKHWVKFEGDGTVAVSDSTNNASITDDGTGDYTLTNTTNFANTNYAFAGGGTHDPGSYNVYLILNHDASNGGTGTSSCSVSSTSPASGGTKTDAELLSFTNHGDLA